MLREESHTDSSHHVEDWADWGACTVSCSGGQKSRLDAGVGLIGRQRCGKLFIPNPAPFETIPRPETAQSKKSYAQDLRNLLSPKPLKRQSSKTLNPKSRHPSRRLIPTRIPRNPKPYTLNAFIPIYPNRKPYLGQDPWGQNPGGGRRRRLQR